MLIKRQTDGSFLIFNYKRNVLARFQFISMYGIVNKMLKYILLYFYLQYLGYTRFIGFQSHVT